MDFLKARFADVGLALGWSSTFGFNWATLDGLLDLLIKVATLVATVAAAYYYFRNKGD